MITLFGGWMLLPDKFLKRFRKEKSTDDYDFGWTTKFTKGFGYASFIVTVLAFYLYYTLAGNPLSQVLVFTLLLLLAVNFYIGNIIAKASQSRRELILPFVDLFKAGRDTILDAGCGTGRTTISLSKAAPDFNIVAFDRFDANYINEGGKGLLKHNLELAGITSRVKIVQGDITATPFNNNYFDAAVSSYMFDHLAENKLPALKEMQRILKPGGRFLLIVLVKGYSAFAIGNVLSLSFAGRNNWKKLFGESGLTLIDEGNINFGAYFLVEKSIGKN
jgi:SAM-dependent methyltransferase